MKKSIYFLILISFMVVISISCMANGKIFILNESSQFSNHQLFIPVQSCSTIYTNNDFSMIEVHCNNKEKKDGIYLIEPSGIRYFNWYSPQFSSWSWAEKCRSKKDCYYKVNLDGSGKIDIIEFHYYINMSEGFYRLKVNKSNLEIIKQLNTDIP